MELVKRCPKCGSVMQPQLEYRFGYAYWVHYCICGNKYNDSSEIHYSDRTEINYDLIQKGKV